MLFRSESLKVHVQKVLIELFKSGVLDNIEVNVTKKQKDDYKTEIDFSEHEIPKKMNANKLYNCFRSICVFKGGKYSLDKVKAGRLLFKIRKDEDKICAFGEEVESNAVEFIIHNLRKKVGAANIKNVRGVGWKVVKGN